MAGSCPVRNFPHKMAGPAPARQRPAANTMTNVQSLFQERREHKARCERTGPELTLHPPPAAEELSRADGDFYSSATESPLKIDTRQAQDDSETTVCVGF